MLVIDLGSTRRTAYVHNLLIISPVPKCFYFLVELAFSILHIVIFLSVPCLSMPSSPGISNKDLIDCSISWFWYSCGYLQPCHKMVFYLVTVTISLQQLFSVWPHTGRASSLMSSLCVHHGTKLSHDQIVDFNDSLYPMWRLKTKELYCRRKNKARQWPPCCRTESPYPDTYSSRYDLGALSSSYPNSSKILKEKTKVYHWLPA